MDFAKDANVNSVLLTNFSCSRCNVKFPDLAKFRDHFRSDWHTYNANKRLNGFSAIKLEDFENKKAIDGENEENEKIKIKKKQICEVCRKKFSSYKQFENHLASKTHMKKLNAVIDVVNKISRREKARDKKKREEATDSNEKCVTNLNEQNKSKYILLNCLFCDFRCRSTVWNLEHMASEHLFHIPDLEYCSNLIGLLKHLEHKISSEFKCIWCNDSGKRMQSAEAAKMHMINKGHCNMFFDEDAMYEYSNFYDYSYSCPEPFAVYMRLLDKFESQEISEVIV